MLYLCARIRILLINQLKLFTEQEVSCGIEKLGAGLQPLAARMVQENHFHKINDSITPRLHKSVRNNYMDFIPINDSFSCAISNVSNANDISFIITAQ